MTDNRVAELLDRERVVDVINALFIATDRRDWAAVRACFAEDVRFDMTSLAGGEPAVLTPADIAAAWESGLAPIEVVHHQAGNYRVTLRGDEADASCYGIAFHYRRVASGRNTRTFVGSYDFHLRRKAGGWVIDAFRFNFKFLDGNADLHAES